MLRISGRRVSRRAEQDGWIVARDMLQSCYGIGATIENQVLAGLIGSTEDVFYRLSLRDD